MHNYISRFKEDENGFAFTATATVVSVILGLTILFMANTIRTESVRVAELHSAQDAYWHAVSDVQMAANMIQTNGTGILAHINSYFPNISVIQTDQTNMVVSSQVSIGTANAGAQRAASINITSPLYSIIENGGSRFDISGFSRLDGGNLYVGGDVRIRSFFGFPLGRVGQDSTVNFYLPTGSSVNPVIPQGGNDYTVTNIAPINLPGFNNAAYLPLINYASNIAVHNPAIGEYLGNITMNGVTLDLQNGAYTGGGLLSGLGGLGIMVNGNLTVNGATSLIVNNNTNASPGFIIVDGDLRFNGPWFLWIPIFKVPDNVVLIVTGNITFDLTNFGTPGMPNDQWTNFVNEIYTQGQLIVPGWTLGSRIFSQFYVFGSFSSVGWATRMEGLLYVPNSTYNFGTLFGAFPRFDGTFYINRAVSDQISWFADINLDSRATLGRALPGGLIQPAAIPWVVKPGSLREI